MCARYLGLAVLFTVTHEERPQGKHRPARMGWRPLVEMRNFVLFRLVLVIPIVLGATVVVFATVQFAPV